MRGFFMFYITQWHNSCHYFSHMKKLFTFLSVIFYLTLTAQTFISHNWNEKGVLKVSPLLVGKLDARGAQNLDSLFQELPKFKNLQWLNLWGLGIEKLPKTLFDSLTDLTWLDLGKNRLTKLPKSFNKLTRLTHLGLYANQLIVLPNVVYKMDLIELSIYENQLSDTFAISPSWKNIKQLNLAGNDIIWINGLRHLRRVERLVLSTCSFRNLPDEFEKCRKLRYFYIDNNLVESLPKSLLRLYKLNYILLEKTNIPDKLLYEYKRKYPRKTFDDCPVC